MYSIIVMRNEKIVWKHGPNLPFFLYNTRVPKKIRTQSTRACMKYKQASPRNYITFKVKGLSSCILLNLRMPGENCLIFNRRSSRTAPGISFFGVPTKDNEYWTNWRNNIVAVITRGRQFKRQIKI